MPGEPPVGRGETIRSLWHHQPFQSVVLVMVLCCAGLGLSKQWTEEVSSSAVPQGSQTEVHYLFCCPFVACRWLPSPWILMQQREEALVPSSSYKGTNLTTGTPPSSSHWDLVTSLKSHLQTPSHWGLGLQYVNLGSGGHLHSGALRSSSWEKPGNFLLLGKWRQ